MLVVGVHSPPLANRCCRCLVLPLPLPSRRHHHRRRHLSRPIDCRIFIPFCRSFSCSCLAVFSLCHHCLCHCYCCRHRYHCCLLCLLHCCSSPTCVFPLKNSLTTKVRGVNSFITPTVPYTVGVDVLNVIIQNYTKIN